MRSTFMHSRFYGGQSRALLLMGSNASPPSLARGHVAAEAPLDAWHEINVRGRGCCCWEEGHMGQLGSWLHEANSGG